MRTLLGAIAAAAVFTLSVIPISAASGWILWSRVQLAGEKDQTGRLISRAKDPIWEPEEGYEDRSQCGRERDAVAQRLARGLIKYETGLLGTDEKSIRAANEDDPAVRNTHSGDEFVLPPSKSHPQTTQVFKVEGICFPSDFDPRPRR